MDGHAKSPFCEVLHYLEESGLSRSVSISFETVVLVPVELWLRNLMYLSVIRLAGAQKRATTVTPWHPFTFWVSPLRTYLWQAQKDTWWTCIFLCTVHFVSHFSPGADTRLLSEEWTIIQFFLCLFCSSHWISFPSTETWDGLTISFQNLQYLTHFNSNCMEEYFHPASLPHNTCNNVK
jgi:hypothetical protein